jgi:hypothetical protein
MWCENVEIYGITGVWFGSNVWMQVEQLGEEGQVLLHIQDGH